MEGRGPTHALIMPTTNMVVSGRTVACQAQLGQSTYLTLVKSDGLADNMYELVPSATETPYRLVVVKEAKDLDATVDDPSMQYLILLIKAYHEVDTKRVLLQCAARQPSVGWYSFRYSVKAEASCKPKKSAKSLTSKIYEKTALSQSKKNKLQVDTTRMSRVDSMFPRDEKMLKENLDCVLHIPKDLSLLLPGKGEMSMYDKMKLIEGDEQQFFSKAAYNDIWLYPTDGDPGQMQIIADTDKWYSRLLLDLHTDPSELPNVRRLVRKQRHVKKQIEDAERKKTIIPGLNGEGDNPYDNAERDELFERLNKVENRMENVVRDLFSTQPGVLLDHIPVARRRVLIKLLGLVRKHREPRQRTEAGAEEEEEGKEDLERPLDAEVDALYSLLFKRSIGNGLRHQMYAKQLAFGSGYVADMVVVDNCINSLYLLSTKNEILRQFGQLGKYTPSDLLTKCTPLSGKAIKDAYNRLLPCGRLAKRAPRMDAVVSMLRAANPQRIAQKIEFRNSIMTVVKDCVTRYRDYSPSFIQRILQLGLDVVGTTESASEQEIREYFETNIKSLLDSDRYVPVRKGAEGDEGKALDQPDVEDDPAQALRGSPLANSPPKPPTSPRSSARPAPQPPRSPEALRESPLASAPSKSPSRPRSPTSTPPQSPRSAPVSLREATISAQSPRRRSPSPKPPRSPAQPPPKSPSRQASAESPPRPAKSPRRSPSPKPPLKDVLAFFHQQGLARTPPWVAMNLTTQLECVMPIVECLWDCVPQQAVVIMGKYVWVHYTRISDGVSFTVVWQETKGTCAVRQNQCRMIAEAFGIGPVLHNAFMVNVNGHNFEGFQTSLSEPPTEASNDVIQIDDQTSFRAVAYLTQAGLKLPFQFDIRESAEGIDPLGSVPIPSVWDTETLEKQNCAVGRSAWTKYLLAAVNNKCKLSESDLSSILRVSFPNADQTQKSELERAVGAWSAAGCNKPQMLLNDKRQFEMFGWRRFKFLACGSYGCSFLWQYKQSPQSRNKPEVEVRKRVLVHTSQYWRKGKIRDADDWWDHPLREFAMLELFHKAGAAVEPLGKPQRTGESKEMLLIKKNIGYYSPIGEQYWTFGMQAGSMTLKAYIECGNLTANTKDASGNITYGTFDEIKNKVLDIFLKLKDNKYTHGDFHLGNLLFLNDDLKNKEALKLIDVANSSNTVFMPWYDLGAFTADCYSISERHHQIARDLAKAVYGVLIKDKVYQKTIDAKLYAKLKNAKGFTNKVGDALPMVRTREVRDHLFHEVYKHTLTAEQLQTDGLAWYYALRTDRGLTKNQLQECAQKSRDFVQFKYHVLTLLLAQ